MSGDPLDELSRRLFSAARAEGAPEELRERLRNGRSIAAHLPQKAAAPARTASTSRSSRGSWLLAAAVLLGGAWTLRQRLSRGDAFTPAPLISAERAVPALPAAAERQSPAALPDTRPSVPEDLRDDGKPPALSEPAPKSPAPSPRAPGSLERASREPKATVPVTPSRATLAEQLESLKRARAALRDGNTERALELLDAYARQPGGSDLEDEASLLRMEALAAAGRRAEAAALSRSFTSLNPDSPLVDRARTFANVTETASEGDEPAEP